MASKAVLALLVVVWLAPPPSIVDCSRPDYRQKHLSLCNTNDTPPYRGGGGSGGGLLGGLLDGLL